MDRPEERIYWARVVREVQKLSKLTLDQLAHKFGVSPREISYWKAGIRRPTGMTAVKFYEFRCELYGDTLRTVVHSASTGRSIVS